MAAKKGTSTTGKKKKAAAGKKPAAKTAARRAPAQDAPRGSRTALFLLVILVLLTVIVFLANTLFFQDRPGDRRAADAGRDAKHVTHDRQEQKKWQERGDPNKDGREAKDDAKENAQPERLVKIYLIRIDDRTERISMNPVSRTVKGEPSVQQALAELIKGPTASEKRRGLLTAVPPDLRVRSVSVKNRTAEIDFNGAIEQNAAGSVLIGRMDQIVMTATGIGGVDSVIIKINGRRRQTLGGDGLSIGGPLHRRQ